MNLVELQGSKKQVKWANDKRNDLIKMFANEKYPDEELKKQCLQAITEAANEYPQANWWIEKGHRNDIIPVYAEKLKKIMGEEKFEELVKGERHGKE